MAAQHGVVTLHQKSNTQFIRRAFHVNHAIRDSVSSRNHTVSDPDTLPNTRYGHCPYTGSGGIAPFLLSLSTRWRWAVSCMHQPLYTQERTKIWGCWVGGCARAGPHVSATM